MDSSSSGEEPSSGIAQSECALLVNLPFEIIEYICQFLSSVDIARLAQTCYRLSIAINKDAVWKRFIIGQEDLHLEQQVEPVTHFENIQVCPKRESFLREQRLLKNWQDGKCVWSWEKINHYYKSGFIHGPEGKGTFYGERYIFIGRLVDDVDNDAIDVWDVGKVPVLYTTFEIAEQGYDRFYLICDFLVVVKCDNVYVYRINLEVKAFPLEYSFVATENSVVLKERVEHVGRHNFNCMGWSYSSAGGGYLIMNKCGEPENVIHVWNIPEGRKEGCFESPMQGFSLSFVTQHESHWVLLQNMDGRDMFYFFFDIERKEFSNYVCKFSSYALNRIFIKNVLLVFKNAIPYNPDGFYATECCVYPIDVSSASTLHDLDSAPELVKRRFDTGKNFWIDSIKVVDTRFAIKCNGFVHLVNAVTLETMHKFPLHENDPITSWSHHINVLGRLFVFVSCETSNNCIPCCFRLLDTVDGKEFILIDTRVEDIFVNNSCTKMIITTDYRLYVLHFW